MCRSPFAYGGPSWSVNTGASGREAISSYTPSLAHHSCIAGSFVAELARISKSVEGSNTVWPYPLSSFFFPPRPLPPFAETTRARRELATGAS